MVRKDTNDKKASRLPAHQVLPTEGLQKVFDIAERTREQQKINEIEKLLWMHPDTSENARRARVLRALELFESLKPGDSAEAMLAMQMVGTHDAALECSKRAALDNQTFEGRDMALKHAQKLMSLYMQQLDALNKHRGNWQQKVTVERVHVEAGGQAIVGNVEQGQSKPPQIDEPPGLEQAPEAPLDEKKASRQRVKKLSK